MSLAVQTVNSMGYTGPVGRQFVSGPTDTLLDVATVRQRLRLPFTDEDVDLQAFIDSAMTEVETYLGRVLLSQVVRFWYDAVPCGRVIVLPEPVTSIVAVKSYATDGDTTGTTLSAGQYELDAERNRLVFDEAATAWPPTSVRCYKAVSVEADIGYAIAGDVPPPIVQAVQLTVQGHYLRGAEPAPEAANRAAVIARLLSPYRYRMGVA
jgi:uncharacterized phiE125 gp8 family phage protein